MNKFYVFCPYGLVTGGTEALHQLVYYAKKQGLDFRLVYCDIKSKSKEIPQEFRCYIDNYCLPDAIVDKPSSSIIVPETLIRYLSSFNSAKKYVWWLSVKNNSEMSASKKMAKVIKKAFSFKTWKNILKGYYSKSKIADFIDNKKFSFNDKSIVHLCASYYAFDYVLNNSGAKPKLLIEPISLAFLKAGEYIDQSRRNDTVLYNPSKNGSFLKPILKKLKNEGASVVPLRGFSKQQLIDIYRTSKLYIDFGPFPGAERMPKEACFNGCNIITGLDGASGYYGDVPIPSLYKFKKNRESVDSIIEMSLLLINNFNEKQNDFSSYRNTISSLEESFVNAIANIFGDNVEAKP